jgi:hypothetical protein
MWLAGQGTTRAVAHCSDIAVRVAPASISSIALRAKSADGVGAVVFQVRAASRSVQKLFCVWCRRGWRAPRPTHAGRPTVRWQWCYCTPVVVVGESSSRLQPRPRCACRCLCPSLSARSVVCVGDHLIRIGDADVSHIRMDVINGILQRCGVLASDCDLDVMFEFAPRFSERRRQNRRGSDRGRDARVSLARNRRRPRTGAANGSVSRRRSVVCRRSVRTLWRLRGTCCCVADRGGVVRPEYGGIPERPRDVWMLRWKSNDQVRCDACCCRVSPCWASPARWCGVCPTSRVLCLSVLRSNPRFSAVLRYAALSLIC